jgi:hypothetical protein
MGVPVRVGVGARRMSTEAVPGKPRKRGLITGMPGGFWFLIGETARSWFGIEEGFVGEVLEEAAVGLTGEKARSGAEPGLGPSSFCTGAAAGLPLPGGAGSALPRGACLGNVEERFVCGTAGTVAG